MKIFNILIVDDEISNLRALVGYLREADSNYKIMKAPNGKVASKIAETYLPDLIITDWEMPQMNGIELIKHMKSTESTKDIPIIMCTGVMTDAAHLKTALEAGAIDYIRKPVEKLELSARVHSMLQLSESAKKIKEQNEEIRTQHDLLSVQKAELVITHENLKKVLERERKSREDLAEVHQNLKNTQSQLVFSEKMASLGQLTAGIAHEINNPMNFVYAGGNSLKESTEELIQLITLYSTLNKDEDVAKKLIEIEQFKEALDYPILIEEVRNLLDDIRVGTERTIEIVKSLKVFSRSDDYEMKKNDIHLALDTTVLMLKAITVGDVVFVKKYETDLPKVACFTGQISQVFINIIGNAIQAVEKEEEGVIELMTKNFENKITISIKDNGEGMTEETKKRIFEPFFTTKEVGKGTGLGMSVSYGIIEKHQGSIEIKSQKGEGAEFIITLPKTNSNL